MEIGKEMEKDIRQVFKNRIEDEEIQNEIIEDLLVVLKSGIVVNHKKDVSYIS